jgi:hypothetical protein
MNIRGRLLDEVGVDHRQVLGGFRVKWSILKISIA